MRMLMLLLALVLPTLALAGAGPALPRFDVMQTCHATSNLGQADEQSFAQCMRDETDVQKQLASNWTSYSAPARSRCSAETMIGGSPSYVELSVCLDIDRSVSEGSTEQTGR